MSLEKEWEQIKKERDEDRKKYQPMLYKKLKYIEENRFIKDEVYAHIPKSPKSIKRKELAKALNIIYAEQYKVFNWFLIVLEKKLGKIKTTKKNGELHISRIYLESIST